MSATLAISSTPFLIKSALIAGGEIQDLFLIDRSDRSITERFLWAKVTRIDPELDAAFLDYGSAGTVFLAAKDARALKGSIKRSPIKSILREGEHILVQGLRDPDGDKGGKVTADPNLFGRCLTYRPRRTGIELSRKLNGPDRDRIEERARSLLPDLGFVLRESFKDADDEDVKTEAAALVERWRTLLDATKKLKGKTGLLPHLDHPIVQIARRYDDFDIDAVTLDDPAMKGQAIQAFGDAQVDLAARGCAFEHAGIDDRFAMLGQSVVPLGSGGRLVIQPTLAATMIDVDGQQARPIDTNLEAAREIARQIRLRNLGGTIIVDFIDLGRAHDRKKLESSIKNACARDRLPVQIYPMSPLGIVQISRAKRGRSLADWLEQPCDRCGGLGRQPSMLRHAEELWTKISAMKAPPKGIGLSTKLDRFIRLEMPSLLDGLNTGTITVESKLDGGWRIDERN